MLEDVQGPRYILRHTRIHPADLSLLKWAAAHTDMAKEAHPHMNGTEACRHVILCRGAVIGKHC